MVQDNSKSICDLVDQNQRNKLRKVIPKYNPLQIEAPKKGTPLRSYLIACSAYDPKKPPSYVGA